MKVPEKILNFNKVVVFIFILILICENIKPSHKSTPVGDIKQLEQYRNRDKGYSTQIVNKKTEFNTDNTEYYSVDEIESYNILKKGTITVNLYNRYEIDRLMKNIDLNSLLNILNTYKYVNNQPSPTTLLETKEGNCSAVTLAIIEWLITNNNPNENEYYVRIVSGMTKEGTYHMYLKLKSKDSDKWIEIDAVSDRSNAIVNLENFVRKEI